MGNICCQTETEPAFLEDDILKIDQYHEATLPVDDNTLSEWVKTNSIQLPTSNEGAPIKIMKHKDQNRYYYGDWRNGVPNGKAFFYEPDKLIFDGNFVDGVPQGFARINFVKQASTFQGELKRGMANGNGRIDNLKQKYNFTGEWQNSKPKNGTLTFASDSNISNIFFSDFSKRQALINYQDNRRYEGQINTSRLVPHGKGKVTFPLNNTKAFYDGQWHNGEMHGKGKFQWTDGSSYEGQFIHGKKQGEGKFTFPNGNYYDGYWFGGKQEGVGTLCSKNKDELKKGVWKAGAFVNTLSNDEWQKQSRLSASRRDKILDDVKEQIKDESKVEEARPKKESAIKQEERIINHVQKKSQLRQQKKEEEKYY